MLKFLYRLFISLILIAVALCLLYNSLWFQKILYPFHYREIIERYSQENDIDPLLVAAIIKVESKFNPNAVSRRGAIGLMQLMPKTAQWMAELEGIEDFNEDILFNPDINIRLGTRYIRSLANEFGQDYVLILAAYNGGRGNVKQWLTKEEWSRDGTTLHDVPFRETREYILRVLDNYYQYRKLYR